MFLSTLNIFLIFYFSFLIFMTRKRHQWKWLEAEGTSVGVRGVGGVGGLAIRAVMVEWWRMVQEPTPEPLHPPPPPPLRHLSTLLLFLYLLFLLHIKDCWVISYHLQIHLFLHHHHLNLLLLLLLQP